MDDKKTQPVSAESFAEANKSSRAESEERILGFWRDNQIFQKTLEKDSPEGEFIFYEGPPTANGTPGIHHLEGRAFKDIFPRYKTMRGYHVARRAGWDTHGLPVELQVEKELELNSKKKIEEYGIARFNEKCRESVHRYIDLWQKFSERIGYWVDFDNAYMTYRTPYIESLWNIVSRIADKDLLYKDYKVVPWCPRCGTALSSHELAQGYKDVKDLSVTAKFKVVDPAKHGLPENTYLLAWTTTPWTLPGNVGLAVGEEIAYKTVQKDGEYIVAASNRLEALGFGGELVGKEFFGKDLVGLTYEPLYSYLGELDQVDPKLDNAYKVYAAPFVTTEDGTGIVHTAVMYGQDDFDLGTQVDLPKFHLVDETGTFIAGTDFLAGRFVKDEEVAIDIIKDLAHRGLLFSKEKYEHSYPHCWRCKTPLIYYARDSWYIAMSRLRDQMVRNNEEINWTPAHIKEGRFGEWLRDIKDWAISRERYWGTPLPIWVSEDGNEKLVVDSYETLKKNIYSNGNTYFAMRHGQAEHNVAGICSGSVNDPYHLTEQGRDEVRKSAETLKGEGIDIIFVSPLLRAKETAEIVADVIGVGQESIVVDDHLREFGWGDFQGKTYEEFLAFEKETNLFYDQPLPGGESHQSAKVRIGEFLKDVDSRYQNKKILFVGHGILLEVVPAILEGADTIRSQEILDAIDAKTAEIYKFDFTPLPLNHHFEFDPHRPFIDEVVLVSPSGKKMYRVKEVMDVWFDSGAMPYAEDHYPFENKKWVDTEGFPADFISEGLDQTRGWFYTLHAIANLLDRPRAYKNVICYGLILDSEGKKMSKSLGNIVDPWIEINKYGADTLRLWMASVNQPADSKNYDEKTVLDLSRKVFGLLENCLAFYELYQSDDATLPDPTTSPAILDQWMLARTEALVEKATQALDTYDLFTPAREIRAFIDDLSTWYVRRSRDRLKGEDENDKAYALATLRKVFQDVARVMAPFTPFFAEDIWQRVGDTEKYLSVHLAPWPELDSLSEEINHKDVLARMEIVRSVVSRTLEARQKAGIKVRQPLASVTTSDFSLGDEYTALIADEVNVKEVRSDNSLPEDGIVLDTNLTDELREEGALREFIRAIQDARKEAGLVPSDVIVVSVDANEETKALFEKNKDTVQKLVVARDVVFEKNEGVEIHEGNYSARISLTKV